MEGLGDDRSRGGIQRKNPLHLLPLAFFGAQATDKWGRFGSPALSLLADHRTVEWPTKESSATCKLCDVSLVILN